MKPTREHATHNAQTYFVTSNTWQRRALFHAEPWARLFFQNLLSYQPEAYLLHEFVLMPDHFHILMSPMIPLERAVQFIKGGFSYRAKKELRSNAEIWQRSFSDHRIRNTTDFRQHVRYIHMNAVKRNLCKDPKEYPYSSAYPGWRLDQVPQGLKPKTQGFVPDGTVEAVPFQSGSAQ